MASAIPEQCFTSKAISPTRKWSSCGSMTSPWMMGIYRFRVRILFMLHKKLIYMTFMYHLFIYKHLNCLLFRCFFSIVSGKLGKKPELSELEVDPVTLDY